MSVDMGALRDSVINLLSKNNATTSSYDISGGLAVRVKSVLAGDPDYDTPSTTLPRVYVRLGAFNEEMIELGRASTRLAKMEFEIFAITQYGAGNVLGGRRTADNEATQLTENIHNLLRAKPDLSITSMLALGVETEFNVEAEASTYVKANKTTVKCQKLVT